LGFDFYATGVGPESKPEWSARRFVPGINAAGCVWRAMLKEPVRPAHASWTSDKFIIKTLSATNVAGKGFV